MKLLKLFKHYSLKSFRKHKLLVLACLFSIVLASGSTCFMLSVVDRYRSGAMENIRQENGNADIKVQDAGYFQHDFSEEQIQELEAIGSNMKIATGRTIQTNVIAKGQIDSLVLDIVSQPGFEKEKSSKNQLQLDAKLAKRLHVKAGDKVFLKLHSKDTPDGYFTVGKIIPPRTGLFAGNSEAEMTENIEGKGRIYLPEEKAKNYALIGGSMATQNSVKKKLKTIFPSEFSIRTASQLKKKVWPRIELQLTFYKLVGALTFIISGICISCATLFFIKQRLKDYSLMQVFGMKKIQLTGLLLTELFFLTLAGALLGISLSLFVLGGYEVWETGAFAMPGIGSFLTNAGQTLLMIFLATGVFAVIPLTYVRTLSFQEILIGNKTALTKKGKIAGACVFVFLLLTGLVVHFAKDSMAILYMLGLALICLLIYGLTSLLMLMTGSLRRLFRSKYRISFLSLKQSRKSISASTTLFSLTMILVLASLLLPKQMAKAMDSGDKIQEKTSWISYDTKSTEIKNVEEMLNKQGVDYAVHYQRPFELVSVNGKGVADVMKKRGLTRGNIERNMKMIFKDLHMDVMKRNSSALEHQLSKGEWFKDGNQEKKILVTNAYPAAVDLKLGDTLELKTEAGIMKAEVSGFLKSSDFSKGIFACVNEPAYPGLAQADDVSFMLFGTLDSNAMVHLLKKDPGGNYAQGARFDQMMLDFMDEQKAFLTNLILVTVFSSLFLLVCVQLILNAGRKGEYQTMFEFGLSNRKLWKITLAEKMLIGLVQTIILFAFMEPVRFLLMAETVSGSAFHLDWGLFLVTYCGLVAIHFCGYLFTRPKLGGER